MVTRLLSDADQRRIEDAIQRLESQSAIEVVVASVARSGDYWHGRVVLGGCWGLAAALTLLHFFALHPLWAVLAELPVAVAVYFLAGHPALLRRLIPDVAAERAVQAQAFALFSSRGLHHTREHTGLLILISELERRVVILGDAGLHQQVRENGWNEYVARLVACIREKRATDGIIEVLERIGAMAREQWPVRADDTNELSNAVITDAQRV